MLGFISLMTLYHYIRLQTADMALPLKKRGVRNEEKRELKGRKCSACCQRTVFRDVGEDAVKQELLSAPFMPFTIISSSCFDEYL